jgi:cation transport ATPase
MLKFNCDFILDSVVKVVMFESGINVMQDAVASIMSDAVNCTRVALQFTVLVDLIIRCVVRFDFAWWCLIVRVVWGSLQPGGYIREEKERKKEKRKKERKKKERKKKEKRKKERRKRKERKKKEKRKKERRKRKERKKKKRMTIATLPHTRSATANGTTQRQRLIELVYVCAVAVAKGVANLTTPRFQAPFYGYFLPLRLNKWLVPAIYTVFILLGLLNTKRAIPKS